MEKLSSNANFVLKRFLEKNIKGDIIETPKQMFQRVARNIASVDEKYSGKKQAKISEKEYFEVMSNLEFLPNLPVLANAGLPLQQLAACFVLPVQDSIESIFQTVKEMAIIQKSGGGTGFNFSELREEGSIVKETGGVASGPLSFIEVFDTATGAIKEGGIRRGANMGILNIEHPDIEKFILAKRTGKFPNFNFSVAITDRFMKAVEKDTDYELISPNKKILVKKESASRIFNLISENAWYNGEPGIIFIDTINKSNPTPKEKISATNPCSEVPLLNYESCILGSINLSKISSKKGINFLRLKKLVHLGIRFLDNTIDACQFPLKEIEERVKQNRKIGLGIMGFADCLIKQGISYNSEQAVKQAKKIMSFIQKEARNISKELAKERGSFPNIDNSIFKGKKMRNATLTAIAPTGTIGLIANCSDGIEPMFNVIFQRRTSHGNLIEFNHLFEEIADRYSLREDELMRISEKGTIQNSRLPEQLKKIFVSAHDIPAEQHIKILAEFQKYTDNGISKTVNLPNHASIEDIKKIFLLAHKTGCKGLTIYRDKSRKEQVLNLCRCSLK